MPYIEVPAHFRQALVTRLKIMCDLDISEKRKPQDGKIKFKKFGPLDIELRVATIPSAGGVEDVVMRILAAGEPIPLEKLGLSPHNRERLEKTVSKPYGLFYVCGPTGSGKTTTLHSILKFLNTPDTKIWTAEDPVEITQKGLRQVQINKKAGIDFALVMRAFLRADPDIIMVGESRDKETVSMGVEASLTGHLVFSTLHTNSAPESITACWTWAWTPSTSPTRCWASWRNAWPSACATASRNTRRTPTRSRLFLAEYAEELRHSRPGRRTMRGEAKKLYDSWVKLYGQDGRLKFYKAVGCDKCNKTGYKGRLGLHELLVADDQLKRLIQERARVAECSSAAVEAGMRTLKMDGMEKIMMGLTDLKQVRSVCIIADGAICQESDDAVASPSPGQPDQGMSQIAFTHGLLAQRLHYLPASSSTWRYNEASTATGFHPDRTDDRGRDHRYSGRGGSAGVPGLHQAREDVRGDPGGFRLPHVHHRGVPVRFCFHDGGQQLGLRSDVRCAFEVRQPDLYRPRRRRDGASVEHLRRHRRQLCDAGPGGFHGVPMVYSSSSQTVFKWICGPASASGVPAKFLPGSCRGS